jgi:hypothetical protein
VNDQKDEHHNPEDHSQCDAFPGHNLLPTNDQQGNGCLRYSPMITGVARKKMRK